MFGTFRFLLAMLVVISHLVGTKYFENLGYYAVRAFFVLSGFVMTLALNEVYRFDIKRFSLNRFLRLCPIYFAVCFLTLLAIKAYPDEAARFMPRWALPMVGHEVAGNFLIVPLAFGDLQFRFIEPAWSLGAEIIMYVLLALGMARSVVGALICFLNGVIYHCYTFMIDAPFEHRYFSVEAILLPFSLGALIYFWQKRTTLKVHADFAYVTTLIWTINLVVASFLLLDGYAEKVGFYINTVLAVLVVISLSALKASPLVRRIDTILGDLSYPIYLVQWLGGFAGYLLLASEFMRGWMLFLISAPIILLLAAVLALGHARLIEPLRVGLRKSEIRLTPSSAIRIADAPLVSDPR